MLFWLLCTCEQLLSEQSSCLTAITYVYLFPEFTFLVIDGLLSVIICGVLKISADLGNKMSPENTLKINYLQLNKGKQDLEIQELQPKKVIDRSAPVA